MKILLCHNYYQQAGGEDQSFHAEANLLRARGEEVVTFTRHNDAIHGMSRLAAGRDTVWNRQTFREVRELIRRERPDVLHCTNTFPLLSPSVYYAARAEGVPVVQSLRNYRLLCPNALLWRDGRACEDCLGKSIPWPGVAHACYRQDRMASLAVTAMVAMHRAAGTWRRAVTRYFTLTHFARSKFIAGGFAPERITVKPNFLDPDPGEGTGSGGYVVFVGRLSPEKGIDTLLEAWARLKAPVSLKIVGEGPLAAQVKAAAERDPRIEWLGHRPLEEVLTIVGDALCLVMPSVWYETFGRTIIEAYAKGTPVIASATGAMAELVRDGETGFLFRPGDAADLAGSIERLRDKPLQIMRRRARAEYEQKYTADINYRLLLDIYEQALVDGLPVKPDAADSIPPSASGKHRLVISDPDPIRWLNHRFANGATPAGVTWPRKVDLFGIGVSVTTYAEATAAILAAAHRGGGGVVACQAVHAVVTASGDPVLGSQVNSFELVTPDGQPVRWAMNILHGTELGDRVYGPELMLRLCREAADRGVSIYLYGGTPEVLGKLQERLTSLLPGLRIAGQEAPPFRSLTPEEDRATVDRINASGAGVVFIGLGCPKQDRFAYQHRHQLKAVQICVGAAFDFHAGVKRTAPGWMQRCGLEWIFRLAQEPRRLWRRYLVTNTIFLARLGAALLRRDGERFEGRHSHKCVQKKWRLARQNAVPVPIFSERSNVGSPAQQAAT